MNLTTKQLTSLIAAAVVAVLTVAWMWLGATTILHGRTVIGPNELKALDPGNEGINIVVSQPWFNDSVLVFNIGKPSKNRDFDRLDATRCLLQCAQSLKNFRIIYKLRNFFIIHFFKITNTHDSTWPMTGNECTTSTAMT